MLIRVISRSSRSSRDTRAAGVCLCYAYACNNVLNRIIIVRLDSANPRSNCRLPVVTFESSLSLSNAPLSPYFCPYSFIYFDTFLFVYFCPFTFLYSFYYYFIVTFSLIIYNSVQCIFFFLLLFHSLFLYYVELISLN